MYRLNCLLKKILVIVSCIIFITPCYADCSRKHVLHLIEGALKEKKYGLPKRSMTYFFIKDLTREIRQSTSTNIMAYVLLFTCIPVCLQLDIVGFPLLVGVNIYRIMKEVRLRQLKKKFSNDETFLNFLEQNLKETTSKISLKVLSGLYSDCNQCNPETMTKSANKS